MSAFPHTGKWTLKWCIVHVWDVFKPRNGVEKQRFVCLIIIAICKHTQTATSPSKTVTNAVIKLTSANPSCSQIRCKCFFFFSLCSFIYSTTLVSNVLSRSPSSSGLLTSPCPSSETYVCFHMASRTAAQCNAVWQGGGLHQFGDRDRPRASGSQPESSANHEPESKGEELLWTSALLILLHLNVSDAKMVHVSFSGSFDVFLFNLHQLACALYFLVW